MALIQRDYSAKKILRDAVSGKIMRVCCCCPCRHTNQYTLSVGALTMQDTWNCPPEETKDVNRLATQRTVTYDTTPEMYDCEWDTGDGKGGIAYSKAQAIWPFYFISEVIVVTFCGYAQEYRYRTSATVAGRDNFNCAGQEVTGTTYLEWWTGAAWWQRDSQAGTITVAAV